MNNNHHYEAIANDLKIGVKFEGMSKEHHRLYSDIWTGDQAPNSYLKAYTVWIKRLDKEDIESLGFVNISKEEPATRFVSFDSTKEVKTRLILSSENIITLQDGQCYTKSAGTIRNKLELENELKRIGLF